MSVDQSKDLSSARAGMVSVVLGRVSTEDGDRVLETLAALTDNEAACPFEIIIADRIQDQVSDTIAQQYPEVRLIPCTPETSLPEMRTLAFDASVGEFVAVTEDHCVPAPHWLDIIIRAFATGGDDLVAVGGNVENGVTETGFDWTTFLCEYSYFSPPVVEGATDVLPGMNIAYRRSALNSVPRSALTSGFWETTVHGLLLTRGGRFLSLNAMKMFHCKKFSVRLFMAQRFLYSRYYAGIRFDRSRILQRWFAAAATVLLPPILLWRMIKAARAKSMGSELRRALPGLSIVVFVWSLGEIVGYLAGPGDALARIE